MSEDDDELPADVVPEAFTVTVAKREQRELEPFDLETLRGRPVEVYANGFRYRGVLQGADERELYLKGLTRWWVLPLDRVASIRPTDEP